MSEDKNDGGWFKQSRKTVKELGYTNRLHAYTFIMLNMNYETGEMKIPHGTIGADFGLSRDAVIRLHNRARTDRGIDRTPTAHPPHTDHPENKGLRGGHRTPTAHPPHSTIKEDRKKKKTYTPSFERVWKVYPRTNGSKWDGFTAWEKHKPKDDGDLFADDCIDAIEKQKAYKSFWDSAGEFCAEFPYFERWMKGRRWENKPEIPPSAVSEENPFADWPDV